MGISQAEKEKILDKIHRVVYEKSPKEVRDYIDNKYKDKIFFETRVVGVTYAEGAQEVLKGIKESGHIDVDILLERERDNPYDINAIAVYAKRNDVKVRIGYINRELASILSKLMDMDIGIKVRDYQIIGGYKRGMSYGVILRYRFI